MLKLHVKTIATIIISFSIASIIVIVAIKYPNQFIQAVGMLLALVCLGIVYMVTYFYWEKNDKS